MIFTSISFLVFYIAIISLLLIFKENTARQNILLVASYFFYGWWNPAFVLLIFISSLWGWYLGLLISRTDNERKKTLYLTISLVLSLGMLAYYKYAEFIAQNFVLLLGLEWDYHMGITLPVGISFFTFQTMSYGIDLKRGRIPVCTSFKKFMLFVAFFPQLVAGPIVRAAEFLPQLNKNIQITHTNLIVGAQIFLGGAIQKVLFADNLSIFADPIFQQPEIFSASTLWLAIVAYSMQIFCDFSGYSLMAIGIAKTLGFELPENFRMPYISRSITEFWRRWHITLSFWLRDYVYISLGGNRNGEVRTYCYLLVTMLLGGLWHGASWNFVLWGALHGTALAIHKFWAKKTQPWEGSIKCLWVYKLFAWMLTFLFVMLAWIPFRSPDFYTAKVYFSNLFGNVNGIDWINPNIVLILSIVAVWHFFYIIKLPYLARFPNTNIRYISVQITLSFAFLMILMFAPINSSPFIYFQF